MSSTDFSYARVESDDGASDTIAEGPDQEATYISSDSNINQYISESDPDLETYDVNR